MPHPEKKDFSKLLLDSQRLVFLSIEISRAASRLESRFRENQLEALVLTLLEMKKQHKLDAAVEFLYKTDPDAYNILLDMIEALSESCVVQHEGVLCDVLLVVAPILAWTRFMIPSGPLSSDLHAGLVAALSEYIFTENARFVLAPELYAIDQLPYSHTEVFSWMKRLTGLMLPGKAETVSFKGQEATPFLADVRYLTIAVLVPAAQPLFRWQVSSRLNEHAEIRRECLENWQKKVLPLLSNVMHGCMLDFMLPGAFFDACRKADQQIRPVSIQAAIHYLIQVLDVPVTDLRAVVAGFVETAQQESITEYRIGFFLHKKPQILYGIVWPVYGAEEIRQTLKRTLPGERALSAQKKEKSPLAEILTLLEVSGVRCEKNHQEFFPMEYCDECSVPLFADVNGELVHAELPESVKTEFQLH